jgi:predicted metal-dependent phosphotriesterase family hydrolase
MKTVPTVYDVRKTGVKVTVNHHRLFYKFDSRTGQKHSIICSWGVATNNFSDYHLCAKGGKTIVTITDSKGEYVGVSVCSENDVYVKRFGTKKALARALAEYNQSL